MQRRVPSRRLGVGGEAPDLTPASRSGSLSDVASAGVPVTMVPAAEGRQRLPHAGHALRDAARSIPRHSGLRGSGRRGGLPAPAPPGAGSAPRGRGCGPSPETATVSRVPARCWFDERHHGRRGALDGSLLSMTTRTTGGRVGWSGSRSSSRRGSGTARSRCLPVKPCHLPAPDPSSAPGCRGTPHRRAGRASNEDRGVENAFVSGGVNRFRSKMAFLRPRGCRKRQCGDGRRRETTG